MPPLSHVPTTVDQQKFVISWLSVVENRLACFGGAGAKAGYGGKAVVKPGTAYNSLAQAVNKKFPGTNWDGESAKCRVRTMKAKFHKVFTLCAGNVSEETAAWKLSEEDKRDGILTLADKAQSMCPHWNSWLEWCGTDPNMTKHGAGESGLVARISRGLGDDDHNAAQGNGGHDGDMPWSGSEDRDDDDVEEEEDDGVGKRGRPGSLASFSLQRELQGDEGHKPDDPEDVPRAVTSTVERASDAPGKDDDLQAQKQKRKDMLARMSSEEKANFYRQEQKEKRQKEQEASTTRRNVVAAAASPGSDHVTSPHAPAQSSSSNSVVSPFGKGNNDWQASFLVDRAKDEEARAEKESAASIAVAKLQVAAADRQHNADLEHKRDLLSFQQQQLNFQHQQMQMQMNMQQSQQMMSVTVDVLYLFFTCVAGTCT